MIVVDRIPPWVLHQIPQAWAAAKPHIQGGVYALCYGLRAAKQKNQMKKKSAVAKAETQVSYITSKLQQQTAAL